MDTELVVRAQHGDEEAFASLAVAVGDRIHSVAHRILRDIDLAEDATQQALLSIWRDLPQLRDPARFDAWSYRLLVRACYAEARRTRRWAPNLRLLPADEPAATDELVSVVDRDLLERGFRRLSVDHRAVVVMHHYLDLLASPDCGCPGCSGGHRSISTSLRDARAAGGDGRRCTPGVAGGCAMSADRDETRFVRSWLEDGVTALPDRVLDAVLDQLPATPQRRATWWPARRSSPMSNFARLGVVASAIVAVAALVVTFLPRNDIGNGPGPGPIATASPTPTPQPFPSGSVSTGGRYAVRLSHVPIDAVVTLEPGWTSGGWFINTEQEAVAFFQPENVNQDACRQEGTLPSPPIGPTVDEFLTALDRQENTEMTTPTDVTIGGVDAKRFELRPSEDAPCRVVRWWKEPCCGEPAFRGAEVNDAAQESPDTVWVLDVAGQRVAVVGYWDHSNPGSATAITNIVESIEFVPR